MKSDENFFRPAHADGFAQCCTKDLNTDNNSRSSADQNWQCSAASYKAHKAFSDGNREIGKRNMVPCHLSSLPPSASQQMLCSTKTLSAAQEWDEICRQWPSTKKDQKKKTLSKSASELTMTTQQRGGGQRASVCTDLSPGIGPITMETRPDPSPLLLL